MLLEPRDVLIIRHRSDGGQSVWDHGRLAAKVPPFMNFLVSIRKRNGAAAVMIIGRDVLPSSTFLAAQQRLNHIACIKVNT